ncbi:MAG: PH domain-containing protein [Paenibacillaceae bacterium]
MRNVPSQRLDDRILRVWSIVGMIHSALICLIAIGMTVLTIIFDLPWYLSVIAIAFAVTYTGFFVFLYPKLRWRRWRYDIHEHEIELMQGVIFLSRTIIPMVRIQHVDTTQGPILRQYGLASITFSTAAGNHEIPGLSLDTADQARERIAELARVSREDV